MKKTVTERGVTIPKHMLGDADEVEIRQEHGTVVVEPVRREDPLAGLGRHPVACGVPDAAERHDVHLYGGDE
jgi:hypothetical protein